MKPAHRLYAMGDARRERERMTQTAEDREQILTSFLESSDLQNSKHNRELLNRAMAGHFYDFAMLRALATANARGLEHRPKPSKPLKRQITVEEVFAIYQQVLDANNSWLADTVENKRRVCELFTSEDPRVSPKLDVMDMKKCVQILAPTLQRVPPPEPPKFPDDDLSQPLSDGSLPLALDAPTFVQRRATIPQMKNLIDRLRRFEAWKQQEQ